jgi:pyruvate,orthophosphate dikinase
VSLHARPLNELRASDRAQFGGKAAGLGEMLALGLPVPQGFALPVQACNEAWSAWDAGAAQTLLGETRRDITAALAELESQTGLRLGGEPPLIVSVRSGAPVSMPGMMDTILNVGLTPAACASLAQRWGDEFVQGCHRGLTSTFRSAAGGEPPEAARDQLDAAIEAVFRSWRTPRAVAYRRAKGLAENMGTAVVVQQMVFGNLDRRSGTGVVFSRDPSTGERVLSGEFALGRQGEEFVGGEITPRPVAALEVALPEAFSELAGAAATLERHFRAVQDIEFTVESGALYLLQTRDAKLAPAAALVTAIDMAEEGLIDADEALSRLTPHLVRAVLLPGLPSEIRRQALCSGLPACPGVASGAAVFSAERAIELSEEREVVLIRPETTPADLNGMLVASGLLTARGGATCHAAVVARDLNLPCVVGCEEMEVDPGAGVAAIGSDIIHEGDEVTVDGGHGILLVGRHTATQFDPPPQVEGLRKLAREWLQAGGEAGHHARQLLEALE